MKIRLGIIEMLGFTGLFICVLTPIIRTIGIIDNNEFNLFWFTPNVGGAWFTTALLKQFFKPCGTNKRVFPINFEIRSYSIICFIVIVLAILNEFAYPLNTSGAFDMIDVIATVVAQIIIFVLPIILKDNCLSNFTK